MPMTFTVDTIKDSADTRYEFGVQVEKTAPKADLYKQQADIQGATDALVKDTTTLKTAMDDYAVVLVTMEKARATLLEAMEGWDASFDIYLALGEKYCDTAVEGADLALTALQRTKYALAMPKAIDAKLNLVRNVLRVHVHRAPATAKVCLQISLDGGQTWVEQEGHGAVHEIRNPPPGTYHIRAACETARARSGFTAPVVVVVK